MTDDIFIESLNNLNLNTTQLEAICLIHDALYEGRVIDTLKKVGNWYAPKPGNHPISKYLGTAALMTTLGMHTLGGASNSQDELNNYNADNDETYLSVNDTNSVEPTLDVNYDITDDSVSVDDSVHEDDENDTQVDADSIHVKLKQIITSQLSEKKKNALDNNSKRISDYVDSVTNEIEQTARITDKYGLGVGELTALFLVESHFNDKAKSKSDFKGIAQLGELAIADAQTHGAKFQLNTSSMSNPYDLHQGVNLGAAYLLRIMHTSERSNEVNVSGNGTEIDDYDIGNILFSVASYNGGIGILSKVHPEIHKAFHNKSAPAIYRMCMSNPKMMDLARQDTTVLEPVEYPGKFIKALELISSYGIPTKYSNDNVTYQKISPRKKD